MLKHMTQRSIVNLNESHLFNPSQVSLHAKQRYQYVIFITTYTHIYSTYTHNHIHIYVRHFFLVYSVMIYHILCIFLNKFMWMSLDFNLYCVLCLMHNHHLGMELPLPFFLIPIFRTPYFPFFFLHYSIYYEANENFLRTYMSENDFLLSYI